jgi:hypothetical protein
MIVHADDIGVYVSCGGWKCRPVYETRFVEGDRVKTAHFGGIVGHVGKDATCGRGEYLERWVTTGLQLDEPFYFYGRLQNERQQVAFYCDEFLARRCWSQPGKPIDYVKIPTTRQTDGKVTQLCTRLGT